MVNNFREPGEVWLIEPEGTRGHEQSGIRPAVILAESVGMYTVVPFTTSENAARFPHTHMVGPDSENGLSMLSFALCFQVSALDKERFIKRTGILSKTDLECIKELIRDLLDL
ncbi:type II toxin-antitoxin system PemK/MazF family toxin [Methanoplanus limicola]|uniref:Transcriptional modulator of MazE/toxin, MazF n=1 Tax=Methanoplanus limicola DSM 2279 TaxID=937775 RepID=H1YXS2_9EURY|nr:type II toxin-antitoxin system PemK/MazF family toxin [Methanoplanus limicola]EHQ35921.1 transcriptional modulator of MazE/toxin, MazF [Methanoplanus limicola DSM 2279]